MLSSFVIIFLVVVVHMVAFMLTGISRLRKNDSVR